MIRKHCEKKKKKEGNYLRQRPKKSVPFNPRDRKRVWDAVVDWLSICQIPILELRLSEKLAGREGERLIKRPPVKMPTLSKLYTMQEASHHNTQDDCWIVVDNKVPFLFPLGSFFFFFFFLLPWWCESIKLLIWFNSLAKKLGFEYWVSHRLVAPWAWKIKLLSRCRTTGCKTFENN